MPAPYRDEGLAALVATEALRQANADLLNEVCSLRMRVIELERGEGGGGSRPMSPRATKVAIGVVLFTVVGGLGLIAQGYKARREVEYRTTRTSALELRRAAEVWRSMHDDGCPSPEDLHTDTTIDMGRNMNDAWGRPFFIRCEGHETIVSSAGPDAYEGTADDVMIPDVLPVQ